MYRAKANCENLNRALIQGVGRYDIPQIRPVYSLPEVSWIGFNYAKGCKDPPRHGVHFFLDDYQFARIWARPDAYAAMMGGFGGVTTPDFSTYTDYPKAIQIYNHYRKHWLGAYWQEHGAFVIPTISWSDTDSFNWCFDGEPVGGIVAVSTVGTQSREESKRLFLEGYREMLRRLAPCRILMHGERVPDGCEGEIELIRPFQAKWRKNGRQMTGR